jgi:hypothetical protein
MGLWANTTYLQHGTTQDVARAVLALCEAEGMEHVPAPPARKRMSFEPMQYDGALHNDFWGFAIFPGAPGWTVIQTAPLELLAERAAGASRMRLAELCAALSAAAFQLNIYDSTETVLVEVSPTGDVVTSGFTMQGGSPDPFAWHAEQLSEETFEAGFRLHPFQDVIADAALGEEKAERLARRFGGGNAAFCDNVVSVDTLISHTPFAADGGLTLHFRWRGESRQRVSPRGAG